MVKLNERGIRALLGTGEVEICVYSSLDSTNGEARRRATDGQGSPMLILAEEQTNGRGRLGRSFHSPAGSGLYMTYLWQPQAVASDVVSATTAAAVAVIQALKSIPGIQAEELAIKWVNDIYYRGRKVCGILTEAMTDPFTGRVAQMWIGIGINVAPQDFPPELSNIATTLGLDLDRNVLAVDIVRRLQCVLTEVEPYAHMDYYRAHSAVIGQQVDLICRDTVSRVQVLDISHTGGLVVQHVDGRVETVHSGEVSLKIK